MAKTVFLASKHLWCYCHIAKNVAKNLKGKSGDGAFKRLAPQMFRAHRQVSIAAFRAIWNGILGGPEFASTRDYLIPTWGGRQGAKVGTVFLRRSFYKRHRIVMGPQM